ncbi:MAG: ThuA domain-containing protein [Xanthomonadales bacterium]|nr:ThuA domain-containing protein [Xanthomonadales bacterium]
MILTFALLGAMAMLGPVGGLMAGPLTPEVLVFSKTAGFRHNAIDAAVTAVQDLGQQQGFAVTATEDAGVFTDTGLARFSAVIFLLTSGDVLNAGQQQAFERYIQAGGGYAGVHSASDTEYDWPWYGGLVGAYFARHPAQQQASLHVEDPSHASTHRLPPRLTRFDEWYDFQSNPRDTVNVLISIDESSYSGGGMGQDHPLAWYHRYDGGRSWYTALGHTVASYSEPEFLAHLLGGIQYAAGLEGPLTVDASGQWFERASSGRPLFMAGAGGPEGFLYENDARKQAIVDQLIVSGANALYMHSIRSFEGDGYDFEDPFNINNDPNSGIAPGVFDNWLSFLTQLDQAEIVTWFHVIDDTARPWGCEVPLSQAAVDYIESLVNTFKHLDHLVWLAGEEYLMGSCSTAQDNALMSAIAAEIRRHDPVHPIGVHHNNGQAMAFGGDPVVNVFAQQICGNSASRSPDGVHNEGEQGSWVYVMAECHPWHLNLLHDNDRQSLRQSNWGSAMAGGYVLLYNAYECAHAGRLCSVNSAGNSIQPPYNDPHDPGAQVLGDLHRLRRFMEASDFRALTPRDDLASSDTRWVLANPASQQYLLYAFGSPAALGVSGLAAGLFDLTWIDPVSGNMIRETRDSALAPFPVPAAFGSEAAVYLVPTGGIVNRPPNAAADNYTTDTDQILTVAAPGVLINDSDLDDDDLNAIEVTPPGNGQLILDSDGGFSYAPVGGFSGFDSFVYRATDGQLSSADTLVFIQVGDAGLSLLLVDADSDQDWGPLSDGQQLVIPDLGFSSFSIRTAQVPVGTASVSFVLTGPVAEARTENAAPYAVFGDTNGDFNGQPAAVGDYSLSVTAYSGSGGGGTVLGEVSLSFAMVNNTSLVFADGFE